MWALVWAACSMSEPPTATWEMTDHDADALAGLEAVRRRDLGALHRAGEGLARPDPAPGLPELGRVPLEQVRERGRALTGVADLAGGAETLGALTEACAACHSSFGIVGVRPADPTPVDLLWSALIFESEERWLEGSADLPEGPLAAAGRAWTSRREVVARLLAEGRLEPVADGPPPSVPDP